MPLRLIFMGTPEFAVPTLLELVRQGHDLAAVYTRAAKPGGRRGLELVSSPVEREARRLGFAVQTPASLKSAEAQATFAAYNADAAVVVAYGLILPQPILDAPKFGCFNLHASLLPHWRGAAPINRAIMAGDAATGVAVMKMDAGLDTGDIAMGYTAMIERVPIPENMTAGELHDTLAQIGAGLMGRALAALESGGLRFMPQPTDGVTYAAKIDKAETRIDWHKPWQAVHDHVRGLSPFPGAWCELAGSRVKVLRTVKGEGSGTPGVVLNDTLNVACSEGAVRIVELQKAGSRPMQAAEFLRGTPISAGTMLG
jgi:methionyl-tRNA formyltransferase